LQAFIDYAEQEQAHDESNRLAMQGDAVDEHIAAFERLARRASLDLNDPSNLRTFARGLPRKLAESCIVSENPEIFAQWARAAQRQQRNSLRNRFISR
jgi:hypothetical protein